MPVAQTDVVVETLFREPLRLVCAPEHHLASKAKVSRKDLAGEKVLTMESGHHLHDQVSRICEDFGAELHRDYEGTSLDTLRLMVGMGIGIAFLPALYIRSEIGSRNEITVVDIEAPNLQRHIALVWRESTVHPNLFYEITTLIRDIATNELTELSVPL